MGMIMDAIGSLVDMKKLADLQGTLEKEVKELQDSGKCPEELTKIIDLMKNSKSDGSSAEASVEQLKTLVSSLSKYSNLFSDQIKNNIPKMEKVIEDLEKKAKDIDNLTKK